jgi:hypothetical protein
MPGPKHGTPRRSGPRPVSPGSSIARTPNRKSAAKLKARQDAVPASGGGYTFHKPGSQNRKK